MNYAVGILLLLMFAFLAPLKVTLLTCAMLLLITVVVMLSAKAVSGMPVSPAEAGKAVVLSFFFLALAVLALVSFVKGNGVILSGLGSWLVLPAIFCAYVLGYQISLDLEWLPSVIVAVVSTVVSFGLFMLLKNLVSLGMSG